MRETTCVGALIRDAEHRVYLQRRTTGRRLFPGTWDIVGGHVEAGESREEALAREIEEETGWTLRRITAVVGEWEWEAGGERCHEIDYLVEVDGDLAAPRLEADKHDHSAWVGQGDLHLLMEGRGVDDTMQRDIVVEAIRIGRRHA